MRETLQVPLKLPQEELFSGKKPQNAVNKVQNELVKPNYLSTFDYMMREKKAKQVDLQQKQEKKSYLQGFN